MTQEELCTQLDEELFAPSHYNEELLESSSEKEELLVPLHDNKEILPLSPYDEELFVSSLGNEELLTSSPHKEDLGTASPDNEALRASSPINEELLALSHDYKELVAPSSPVNENFYAPSPYNEELRAPSPDMESNNSAIETVNFNVKDIIRRFESGEFFKYDENLPKLRKPIDHLSPRINRESYGLQDRYSNVSVNSILSNTSEMSFDSSSSGFDSDRKSGIDMLVPHRLAPPPPPEQFCDHPEDSQKPSKERRFSLSTPRSLTLSESKRARQPPVILRKSKIIHKQWTYGMTQRDLELLLRLKLSDKSDNEEELTMSDDKDNNNIYDSDVSNETDKEDSFVLDDNKKDDTISNDCSTDTIVDENEEHCESDNLSIVSDQDFDRITISSNEFGSCQGQSREFLIESAVNECCKTYSVSLPVETKKQKYRRHMNERVKELIHTESVYVNKLRNVIENYMPELDNVPISFKILKKEIFANIESIYKFHSQEFLPALKSCENDLRKLGHCFRRFEHRFNMYVMYSRQNKRATKKAFEHKHFFQEKQLQLGDRLDLSSYLLEPVQRIPRYRLFLNELVDTYIKYDNEKGETESIISKLSVDSDETGGSNGELSECCETPLESLKSAGKMVETLLIAIDDIMALENIRLCPPYINLFQQGRLLLQNEFYCTDSITKKRQLMRVFLFDKLVLLTVVHRKQLTVDYFHYKDHILVDDLGITAKEQDLIKFSIWYKKIDMKSFKLESKSPEVRQEWVNEISGLLWNQAAKRKELIMEQRKSAAYSQETSDGEKNEDKYKSLRGVPGEMKSSIPKVKKTATWYCE